MSRRSLRAAAATTRARYVDLRERLAENHVPELLIGLLASSTIFMGATIGLDPTLSTSRSFGAAFNLLPPVAWGWLLSMLGLTCGILGSIRRRWANPVAWTIAATFGLVSITTMLSIPGGGFPLASVIFLTMVGLSWVTAIAATGRRGRR